MSNEIQQIQVTQQTQVTFQRQSGSTEKPKSTPTVSSLGQGDSVTLSNVRSNILQLEAQITQFKLQEEQQLGQLLNEQLSQLEQSASQRRNALNVAMQTIGNQYVALPAVMDSQSVAYSLHKQIESQQIVNLKI